MRNTRLSRVTAALTALAAVAAVAVVGSNVAQALPPGSPANPGQTLSPSSGTQTTSFTLSLATGNNLCPGDATTAGGGYRWQQYITSRAVDAGTLTYDATGPVLPAGAPAGSIAQPLYSTTGTPQVARSTLAAGTGQITGATTLNFVENVGVGLPAGQYKIGFACSQAGQTARYWQTPITVAATAGGISWQFGWVNPVTGLAANGESTTADRIVGSFTAPASALPDTLPAASYTVTATPVGGVPHVGPSPVTGTVTGTNYEILGLTNGTQYNVTVVAFSGAGATGIASPVTTVQQTVSLLKVTPGPTVTVVDGPSPLTMTITPSTGAAGETLVDHLVTITPVGGAPALAAPFDAPLTVPAGSPVPALVGAIGDSYEYTVIGRYASGRVTVDTIDTFSFINPFVGPVIQEITVERPAGALVLTQRCGVFGSAPAFTDNTFGPLPALPASPASADPTNANPLLGWLFTNPVGPGSAPSVVTGTDANGFPELGALDTPNFGEYPYPVDANEMPNPTYPTHCGINLGNAQLLTSGEFAGVYFAATGRINQLSVVDTRDLDEGWTLNGRMGDFRSEDDLSDTFHGNLMGWDPEVTWDSAGSFDGYNMVVTPGPSKNPRAQGAADGLRDVAADNELLSRSLAQANPGQGLGIAVMDARLRLLIPVTADAGTYRGTLTFTAV